MFHLDTQLSTGGFVLLAVALTLALAFEFVNGFHDTANAVATVIYTKSLKPMQAVAWSGLCNFLGVYVGGIAVAMSILKLLPPDLLAGGGGGLAMVLALLSAAILWNLGTWYLGLPASSSHTLIGAILGVGIANSLLPGHVFGEGVNWGKVTGVGLSLLVSPIFGLSLAAALVLLSRKLLKSEKLHQPASATEEPPSWIRAILITTCSGVSFAHGSNDGQKGVGLIMLILIGLLPADFALNNQMSQADIQQTASAALRIEGTLVAAYGDVRNRNAASGDAVAVNESPMAKAIEELQGVRASFQGRHSVSEIPAAERYTLRGKIAKVDSDLAKLEGDKELTAEQRAQIAADRKLLKKPTEYAPTFVLVLVALALGIGTMIGWKRIVVTIGEKIGKTHLSYAQGASAELVAMGTIGASAFAGLPVSTTHVLSSGIAGTMVAQKSGLQGGTVRNIALAWIFTLPASMLLAGGLFLLFRTFVPDAAMNQKAAVQGASAAITVVAAEAPKPALPAVAR